MEHLGRDAECYHRTARKIGGGLVIHRFGNPQRSRSLGQGEDHRLEVTLGRLADEVKTK
jgi:hypothetical protein